MTSAGHSFLVLGGSGLIGSAIVKQIRTGGDAVFAPSSKELDLQAPTASAALESLLTNDTILLCAMRARPAGDGWLMFQDDLRMSATVAAVLARRQIRKCVYFSSLAVYGDDRSNVNITEDTAVAPSSPYGVAKLAGEQIVRNAADQSGTPALILRPCMVYGPGDATAAYGPSTLARAAVHDGRVSIFGDGKEQRPYIYIDDAASLAVRLAEGAHQGVLNVAAGTSDSFEQVVQSIGRTISSPIEVTSSPRKRPQTDLGVSIARLESLLPGLKFVTLDAGLAATCQAYQTAAMAGSKPR